MILWLDVEDLFHYALRNSRPSGIQRLSFELYRALHDLVGDRGLRFVRHDPVGNTLRTVSWSAVEALFSGLMRPSLAAARRDSVVERDPVTLTPVPRGSPLRRLAVRLPLELRDELAHAYAAQRLVLSAQAAAFRHGARALREAPRLLRSPAASSPPPPSATEREPAPMPGEDLRDGARDGDVFGVLGSPWFHPAYTDFIAGAMRGKRMRTALLVYDLIPLVRPEWCERGLVRVFTEWFAPFAPMADHLLAISESTARDTERWAARNGIALRGRVTALPIGTGFTGPSAAAARLPEGLAPGSYALFVSTIEARKNHLLAFRAWRRMVEEMPPEGVPTLVFAGRVGWMVADLMQQLRNCAFLDGKIRIVQDPTDADLVALYRGCRFTLFPSLYEGWGLPVTESLSFGKLCVASDRSSVPEAGGDFCLYLDPENITAATEVIRRACTDDALVAEREAYIRDAFRPTPWRATAEAVLRQVGAG